MMLTLLAISHDDSNILCTAHTDACIVWYVQVMMSWNAMGYRTLGVVSGKVVSEHHHDISKISLANINDHVRDMRFLGIMVLNNPLRSDSAAAIAELQNK